VSGRVLVTGGTGALGSEVAEQLAAAGHEVVRVARRVKDRPDVVRWPVGAEPPPPELDGTWDVVVNCAASTRWSMTAEEAETANVATVGALAPVLGPGTRFVHVSTAFVTGVRAEDGSVSHRNEYERSKARSEAVAAEQDGELHLVRPPLIVGRRRDGQIARFSGTYSLLQSMTSGLAPAIVGDPEARIEVAPVDDVAALVVEHAVGEPERVEDVIAGGPAAMTLSDLVTTYCDTLNVLRVADGVAPLEAPPFLEHERWERFYRPFIIEHLRPLQRAAIDTLSLFHAYTAESAHIVPTRQIEDPRPAVVRGVQWWAACNPRAARRIPAEWT
jgi:nucleoside-diphosphate-sugar epimerase